MSAASGHCLTESFATFCTSAAAAATTAAAADPLAGAGSDDAIFVSRYPKRLRDCSSVVAQLLLALGDEFLQLFVDTRIDAGGRLLGHDLLPISCSDNICSPRTDTRP